MANTTTGYSQTFLGFNVAAIAEEVANLKSIYAAPTPLSFFATHVSDLPVGVTTFNFPLPTYATGSSDMTTGMQFNDAAATTIALQINKDAGYYVKFNPVEAQQNGLGRLVSDYIKVALVANDTTVMSASIAVGVTNTSNTTSSYRALSGASFSASVVASIASDLAVANITDNTFMLMEPTRYWGLVNDLSTKGNQAGADAVRTGTPNNPFGIPIASSNLIPTLTGSATLIGTGNLVGIAGSKNNAIVATVVPNVVHSTGDSFIVESPAGIKQLVEFYFDESRRSWVIGASVVHGEIAGTNSLKKITDKA